MYTKLALVVVVIGAVWTNARSIDAAPKTETTLLSELAEWQYPDSKFGGASMSDGGNRTVQSVNCQALLTTPDPFEKVALFYAEKFVSGPAEANAPADKVLPQSVLVQDNSDGRPVHLRVITVNRAETSTTLAISRADGEKVTHIAWSHHVRLGGGR